MRTASLVPLEENVSRETLALLQDFKTLVEKWTSSINLIAPNTVATIWDRHIVDSAQIYEYADPSWKNWLDIGSGGGFPGIVIAILDETRRPVTLVESDARKCLFLNTARRELGLNVIVKNERIEKLEQQNADVLSARALAPLSDLLGYTHRHLSPNGTAILQKGKSFQEELDDAKENWHFDHKLHTSITNPESRILEISGINRRES